MDGLLISSAVKDVPPNSIFLSLTMPSYVVNTIDTYIINNYSFNSTVLAISIKI